MKGQAKLALLILLGGLVFVAGYGMMTYNRIVRLHEQIPAAWSQVENVLQAAKRSHSQFGQRNRQRLCQT